MNVKEERAMQILRRTNESADLVYFIAAFISASQCFNMSNTLLIISYLHHWFSFLVSPQRVT